MFEEAKPTWISELGLLQYFKPSNLTWSWCGPSWVIPSCLDPTASLWASAQSYLKFKGDLRRPQLGWSDRSSWCDDRGVFVFSTQSDAIVLSTSSYYRDNSISSWSITSHIFKFFKSGAILPIYIHKSLSLSFSVQYTEQTQAILLHELHWQCMHVYKVLQISPRPNMCYIF